MREIGSALRQHGWEADEKMDRQTSGLAGGLTDRQRTVTNRYWTLQQLRTRDQVINTVSCTWSLQISEQWLYLLSGTGPPTAGSNHPPAARRTEQYNKKRATAPSVTTGTSCSTNVTYPVDQRDAHHCSHSPKHL